MILLTIFASSPLHGLTDYAFKISWHLPGHHPAGVHVVSAVWHLLPVPALPHTLLHPEPGGGDWLLDLVCLCQLCVSGFSSVWGPGEWKATHFIVAWHHTFQIGKIGLILTFLFCFLLVPIMMLYRHTELEGDSAITPSLAGARRALRGMNSIKYPPKYEDSKSFFLAEYLIWIFCI